MVGSNNAKPEFTSPLAAEINWIGNAQLSDHEEIAECRRRLGAIEDYVTLLDIAQR
jgi:hypothetical protein